MIGLAESTAIFMALTQEQQVSAMPWWALALGVFLSIGAGTVPQERLLAASVRRKLLAIAAMLVTVLAVLVALHPSRIAAGLPPLALVAGVLGGFTGARYWSAGNERSSPTD